MSISLAAAVERPLQTTPLSFLIGLNLYIAAIYTNIGITVGGFVVPGILGVVGALFMLRADTRNLTWLLALIAFLSMSLVFGGSGMELFDIRLPSYIQIVAAIVVAHILLNRFDYPVVVRRTLLGWTLFITVGVILETVFPQFKDFSDAFRESVFEGRFIYDSTLRDLREYGFERPNLFTQEPSHISKAFVIFGAGWYVLTPYKRRLVVLIVCSVLVTYFLRSPFVLLAIPMALFLAHMLSGRSVPRVAFFSIPVIGAAGFVFSQVFSTRFNYILSGQDFSFFSRYLGPYEVTQRAVAEHPIFGVGIGAKEALRDDMLAVYDRFVDPYWTRSDVYLDFFNNAFANSFMFFGVAGALLFYLLVAKWAAGFDVRPLVALMIVFVFFQLDGAMEGIRMWSSIAMLWGCYMIAKPEKHAVSERLPLGTTRLADR